MKDDNQPAPHKHHWLTYCPAVGACYDYCAGCLEMRRDEPSGYYDRIEKGIEPCQQQTR